MFVHYIFSRCSVIQKSLFLKTERRIMALTMILVLALLVYALAEEELRRTLKTLKGSVPNQKKN